MPFYERQPYIQPLHQIIKEVMQGEIRVPRFQRPGTEETWKPEQRGDLLDSLYRGFPVGTILLWSTTSPIKTYEMVGGCRVPSEPPGAGRPQRLLLDGHQRLSTLVRILGPGLVPELAKDGIANVGFDDKNAAAREERWVFELSPGEKPVSSRDRFILLKAGQDPTPTQIPLSIVLSRSDLNRWVRQAELTDAQETETDNLRDRLREYTIPVAVLVADSLQEATESFKRVNSSGTSMTDFHMVAALAYEKDYDPQAQFEEMRAEYLAPIGWESISDNDVLRIAAGLDGKDKKNPLKLDVSEVAVRLRQDRELVKRAFQTVTAAATLLRRCGVHGPKSLPYIWQLITLAVYLGRVSSADSPASFDEASALAAQRWFWLTTYGEAFSGVNSALFDRSLGALQDMIEGKDWSKMDRDVTRRVRPVTSFDFRAVRSGACALAMARYQDREDVDGAAHRALATGVEAMQLLRRGGKRSRWWDLAIVTQVQSLTFLREALQRRARGEPAEPHDHAALEQIGVEATDTGSMDELLAARRDRFVAKERAFVEKLGLEWASGE